MEVPTTPAELGFDREVLPGWRPFQRQTVQKLLDSDKQLDIISAPAGAGKSALALGLGRMLHLKRETTTVLTHQRALQDQYLDYELDPPLRTATGRANWECVLPGEPPGMTAASAPCTAGFSCPLAEAPHPEDIECPYYRQKALAEAAPIRILNYPYFFLMSKNGAFKTNALICDEGHRVDKAIVQAETVTIDTKQLALLRDWGVPFPRVTADLLENSRALPKYLPGAIREVGNKSDDKRLDDKTRDLARVVEANLRQLEFFDKQRVTTVVKDGYTFIPVVPEQLAERVLTRGLQSPRKLILMSASIYDADYWSDRVGISRSDSEYIELPSGFPPERRPIYIKPVAKLNATTTKDPVVLQQLADACDDIIERYRGRRGVIHSASFSLGREIYERSRNKDRLILAEPRENRMAEFEASTDGVYISPSAYEGYDWKDDQCRFSIIAKLSWPNRGDPVVRAQLERLRGFNEYETASALIQAVGRGMRHKDDWCHSFVLDQTFYTLWGRTKDKLPGWFKAAIVWPERGE